MQDYKPAASLMAGAAITPTGTEPAAYLSKLAIRLSGVARTLDVSTSTVRRRRKDDPEFPKPFRLSPKGDWLWSVADLYAYVAAKAARARAA